MTDNLCFSQRLKHLGVFTFIVLLYILFMNVTGIGCPIRWMTGISCPGCGMSRAFFALLHLDFEAAFHYHPMIYPLLIFIPYLFLGSEKTKRRRQFKRFLMISLIILTFFVYFLRIFHEDTVLSIDPSNGVMLKFLQRLQGGI